MRGNRAKSTKPELKLRKLLTSLGHRYRLHRQDLPGRPDIVFPGRRKAIFVHGCFWHQHPDPKCRLRSAPKTNTIYWGAKLARNVERDIEHQIELGKLRWEAITVWECDLQDLEAVTKRLKAFLS